jgi:hypothetical protein
VDEGKQGIMARQKLVHDVTKEAKELWGHLLEEKPVLPFLIPVFLLAWILERWIISFSNWVPVFVTVWASLQVHPSHGSASLLQFTHSTLCK